MGAGRLCSARRAPQLFHTAFCATLLAALLVYDTGLRRAVDNGDNHTLAVFFVGGALVLGSMLATAASDPGFVGRAAAATSAEPLADRRSPGSHLDSASAASQQRPVADAELDAARLELARRKRERQERLRSLWDPHGAAAVPTPAQNSHQRGGAELDDEDAGSSSDRQPLLGGEAVIPSDIPSSSLDDDPSGDLGASNTPRLSSLSTARMLLDSIRRGRSPPAEAVLEAAAAAALPERHCGRCQLVQPVRSKHCSTCRGCVRRFDHHCPFLGTCIGQANHRRFVLFLGIHAVMAAYALRLLWGAFASAPTALSWLAKNLVLLLLHIGLLVSVLLAGALFVFHVVLAAGNQTTWELLAIERVAHLQTPAGRRPFDDGIVRNLRSFFCGGWCGLEAAPDWDAILRARIAAAQLR